MNAQSTPIFWEGYAKGFADAHRIVDPKVTSRDYMESKIFGFTMREVMEFRTECDKRQWIGASVFAHIRNCESEIKALRKERDENSEKVQQGLVEIERLAKVNKALTNKLWSMYTVQVPPIFVDEKNAKKLYEPGAIVPVSSLGQGSTIKHENEMLVHHLEMAASWAKKLAQR